MGSSSKYEKLAAECARMAHAAPSELARASFAAAANYWMALSQLAGTNTKKKRHSQRCSADKPDAMTTKRGG
jgi:hypothetical protein